MNGTIRPAAISQACGVVQRDTQRCPHQGVIVRWGPRSSK
jgi:hypothetical protein